MTNKPRLRVLQVIDTLGMGGAETWLMEVLRLWSKSGEARMDFLVTSGNRGIFDDEAVSLGAAIHYVRYGRASLGRFARAFRQILRNGNYDAIHDHQDYSSGWHFMLGTGLLPPVRATHVHNPSYQIHNNYGVTRSRRLTARIGKTLVANYATHITGTSRQVLTEYGFDTPQFRHIPKFALHCGFDPARFLGSAAGAKSLLCREWGWPDNARIILFAGRMDQSPDAGAPQNHKNSGFAVNVCMESLRRDPGLFALFVGNPSPALPVLQQRVAQAGLTNRFRFPGIRKDIEQIMLGSDVLLFPSRGEGLGMVAVEAQSAGLPVLASTAVPRESVVVPELVRFRELDADPELWVSDILALAAKPRAVEEANRRVAQSPFAILNSAKSLADLYRNGAGE